MSGAEIVGSSTTPNATKTPSPIGSRRGKPNLSLHLRRLRPATALDHSMSHAPNLSPSTQETAQHPARMSLRGLIAELSATEDRLRHLPTFAPFGGRLVINPERRLVLRHQRLVLANLRRRRATLRTSMAGR